MVSECVVKFYQVADKQKKNKKKKQNRKDLKKDKKSKTSLIDSLIWFHLPP